MKNLNYLVKAKQTIENINKRMERGEGLSDNGLQAIADEVGLSFVQIKRYIQSF